MNLDSNMLATLGISAAMIPFAGSIVKATIDIFRGAFDFDARQCVVSAYCLSFLFICLLQFLVPFDFSLPGFAAFVAKTVITAWFTANYAAMLTDVHNSAREEKVCTPVVQVKRAA